GLPWCARPSRVRGRAQSARVRSRGIMFSQPHTVLPWVVRRTRLPLLRLACAACPSQTHTTGRGRFRVNANGKLLHVWLLVRCRGCDRTVKLTVHERTPVSSLAPAELDGYHRNDAALV